MSKTYRTVGVIGAGTFGTAIAGLLAENYPVLVYSRNPDVVKAINNGRHHPWLLSQQDRLKQQVRATEHPEELAQVCRLIFPIVSSEGFRSAMRLFSAYLKPHHLLIHGTKGLDLNGLTEQDITDMDRLTRAQISTMSEVILEETSVVRVGCLSGPNLAAEIIAGQPATTLVASRYLEVIEAGIDALNSQRFHVFGSHEILGAELAGAFKNIIALASGMIAGLGLGHNTQAALITRGLAEMIHLGAAMGADKKAFLGTAGIGDLIATATSPASRNFMFGRRIAQGESTDQIRATMHELAEGVRTLRIAHKLGRQLKVRLPITAMLYKVVFENFPLNKAVESLVGYPYTVDVDFL